MKTTTSFLTFLLLFIDSIPISAQKHNNVNAPVQVEKLNIQECDYYEYAPVTGSNFRCYLNSCWAQKNKVAVIYSGYNKKNYRAKDVYTWPIEHVCIPMATPDDPVIVRSLDDGTLLYKTRDKKQFRGTPNTCRCLPSSTFISTPKGPVLISLLVKGDSVYSVNTRGEKIIVPLIAVNKTAVEPNHRMLNIELADGRKLQVTPDHPAAADYFSLTQYETGTVLDKSTVTQKYFTELNDAFTYDILPGGDTGYYWANDILIGSTLFNSYSTVKLLQMGW